MAALSRLATWHWAFELLSHFHVYFLLAGAALAVVAAGLQQWWTAGLSALVIAASFSVVWPHMHLPPADLQPQPGPAVRLLWANLHNGKTDLAALRRLIEAEKPDIAVFTELDPAHDAVLRDVRALLPFQSPPPRGNAFGVMLLAKKPPESLKFDLTTGDDAPLMVARLCPVEEGCLTVLGLHAWRPGPGLDRRPRPPARPCRCRGAPAGRQGRACRPGGRSQSHAVLAGLPAGCWRKADCGTRTSCRPSVHAPRPSIATWRLANTGLGLPIDHALVSAGIGIVSRRVGPDIGSDHRPLILDLKIPPSPGLQLASGADTSGGRAPNRALPTRTWVAPSRTAVS